MESMAICPGARQTSTPSAARRMLKRDGKALHLRSTICRSFLGNNMGICMVPAFTSRTSAEPHMLETERLPCLATLAPAAAARMAAPVEMFTDPMPSPPVPTMSTRFPSAATGTAFLSMARANPMISSGVSPCIVRPSTFLIVISSSKQKMIYKFMRAACCDLTNLSYKDQHTLERRRTRNAAV